MPEPKVSGQSKILIINAMCDPDVCQYFSQRGNGILGKLAPVCTQKELMDFLEEPCAACGQQVMVASEPYHG